MNPLEEFLQETATEEKKADVGTFMQHLPGLATEQFVGGLAKGVVGAAVVGTGMAAHKLYQAATKNRDFKTMLEYNPDLAEHHVQDPKMFNQMYTTLRNMNPTYAADPIVAGTFMRNMVNSPSAAGGFATEALSGRDKGQNIWLEGMLTGMKGTWGPSQFPHGMDDEAAMRGQKSKLDLAEAQRRAELGPLESKAQKAKLRSVLKPPVDELGQARNQMRSSYEAMLAKGETPQAGSPPPGAEDAHRRLQADAMLRQHFSPPKKGRPQGPLCLRSPHFSEKLKSTGR